MTDWNTLFQNPDYHWQNPYDGIANLIPLMRERGVNRVLDLGCGAGRHVCCMARMGFDVCGVDIAETGLLVARKLLVDNSLTARLCNNDMAHLICPSATFDAVISTFAIYHQTLDGMKATVNHISRVLKEQGLFYVIFRAPDELPENDMELIEPMTYRKVCGEEAGLVHHFSTETEICELLAGFTIAKIVLQRRENCGYRMNHYEVLAWRK